MRPEDLADTRPLLDLEAYFDGPVRAWGLFQDRFGRVHRPFTVEIQGRLEEGTLILEEDFFFADGETDRRVWHLRRLDAHTYEGRADDVEGVAQGRLFGQAFRFRYTLRLPVTGRTLRVQMDDWMFLHEDGMLINRAVMRKFGLPLGDVTLVFRRMGS